MVKPLYSVPPEEHPLLPKVSIRGHQSSPLIILMTFRLVLLKHVVIMAYRDESPDFKDLRNLKHLRELPVHTESSCILCRTGDLLVNGCSLFKEERLKHTDPLLTAKIPVSLRYSGCAGVQHTML